eukprot:Colp12_sorted_trinity150504_noHs@33982
MLFDVQGTVLATPQTLLRVTVQQLREEITCLAGHVVREHKLAVQNFLVHGVSVLVVERRDACKHLVDQHTQGPPVNGGAVALLLQNLGSHILGGATEGVCSLIMLDILLAQTEVSKRNIPIIVHKNVLRLEISVYNVIAVQVVNSKEKLSCIEACSFLVEHLLVLQMEEQLTTIDVVEDQVYLFGIMEGVLESYKERVGVLGKDLAFRLGVLDLVSLHKSTLLKNLHGIDTSSILLPHLHNLAKATLANNLEQFEVINGKFLAILLHETGVNTDFTTDWLSVNTNQGVPLVNHSLVLELRFNTSNTNEILLSRRVRIKYLHNNLIYFSNIKLYYKVPLSCNICSRWGENLIV